MQVTYKNHVLIFNLNLASPCLYDEIDATDELYDPNKFIEVGFKL